MKQGDAWWVLAIGMFVAAVGLGQAWRVWEMGYMLPALTLAGAAALGVKAGVFALVLAYWPKKGE